MTKDREAARAFAEQDHKPYGGGLPQRFCRACQKMWPCPTRHLLDALAVMEAEREEAKRLVVTEPIRMDDAVGGEVVRCEACQSPICTHLFHVICDYDDAIEDAEEDRDNLRTQLAAMTAERDEALQRNQYERDCNIASWQERIKASAAGMKRPPDGD